MSEDVYNIKDMSFEAKFTIDEEGLRGLAAFLKEQEDETLDAIFGGKRGLILHDPKRGTAEVRRVVQCKDCKHLYKDGECPLRTWFTHDEDDYCSYGERKEQEHDNADKS